MTLDTCFVYDLQNILTQHILQKLLNVKKIIFFSDGCAGQYKNFKNFLNLTYYETDFGIVAVWIFFATSHGKSPCDGLGEAVKRKLTNVSLKRPLQDQIVTPQKCYTEAQALTPSVMFLFIPRSGVELTRH